MIEMAKRSVNMNGQNDKIEMIEADIIGLSRKGFLKKLDYVITNPPYKKLNTGLINENEKKLVSKHEYKCNLEDIIKESSKMLKDLGTFYMVHRPERMVEILETMRKFKIEPKEIQFVYPKSDQKANLILIKGTKCGKPFLKVLEPLIIYNEKNEYTEQILTIYEE